MEKLEQIQQAFNKGCINIGDIQWLIDIVKDLEFETECTSVAYNEQFELTNAVIEQNDDLREQLKQANKQIQELESEIAMLKNVNNSI